MDEKLENLYDKLSEIDWIREVTIEKENKVKVRLTDMSAPSKDKINRREDILSDKSENWEFSGIQKGETDYFAFFRY
jgi:hypothetical protein